MNKSAELSIENTGSNPSKVIGGAVVGRAANLKKKSGIVTSVVRDSLATPKEISFSPEIN